MSVAEHLHFHVPGVADVTFHVERVVAEGGPGFRGRGAEGGLHLVRIPYQLDAAATASGRGLEQHRITDLLRLGGGFARILRMIGSRHRGHAGSGGNFTRGQLVAHMSDVIGAGPNEGNLVVGTGLGQLGSFGEKTVSGVEGIAAHALGRSYQGPGFEIAIR